VDAAASGAQAPGYMVTQGDFRLAAAVMMMTTQILAKFRREDI